MSEDFKETTWIDNKGRTIYIHTMSDKWLKNIREACPKHPKIQLILDEIDRRNTKRHWNYRIKPIKKEY